MQHLDEGTVHAWIDGELSPEQASELETHVRDCAACAAMVAEARGLVAASTRILTALDHVPGGVLPSVPDIAPAPAQIAQRRWYQRTDVRAAAALLFVAGTSLVVVQSRTGLRGTTAMVADQAPVAASSAIATEATGADAAGRAQPGMADAANVSPLATAPAEAERSSRAAMPEKTSARTKSPDASRELRFGAVAAAGAAEGAKNQVLQQKVMADDRAAVGALRDESQLSKEEASKRRAADADLPAPPTAHLDAAAPTAAAAPAEARSRVNAEVTLAAPATPPVTVSAGAAVYKSTAAAPLRIVRVDSTSGAKRTVYEVSRGVEVTLTESPAQTAAERDSAAKDLGRQKAAAPQRAEAAREPVQVLGGRAAGVVPAPAAAAPMLPPLNTISWSDRGKMYTLTGRLTAKDLEAIKARLMQMRR